MLSKKQNVDKMIHSMVKNFIKNQRLSMGLIILVVVSIYYNSMHAPFNFDDISKIVENPDIKDIRNIPTKLIYPYGNVKSFERNDPSRPITYLTFTLNYFFGKLNTFGYRLVNVLLHICVAVMLFFLARRILSFTYGKYSNPFALFVALVFASHPINTVVVSYIFNRAGQLSALFYMLSLLLFIKTFEKGKVFYVLSLICFVLGIFSKQDCITLPVIVLIFDFIFLSNFKLTEVFKRKYYHLPYWLIVVAVLLFRYFYFGQIGDVEASDFDRYRWSRYTYFIIQPYVILRYIRLIVIPSGFCFDHVIAPVENLLEFKIIIPFISIIMMFTAILIIFKKKTDKLKIFLFCFLWFLITLSPTSSFFPTTTAMAENRVYIPGFGLYFIIVYLCFLFFRNKLSHDQIKWPLTLVLGTYIVLLGTTTVKRNKLYQDPVLLWKEAIRYYPNNTRAIANASALHNNLGISLRHQGKYEQAIQEFKKALEIKPDNAEARYNMGLVYLDQKLYDLALDEFKMAVKINPNHSDARNNIGWLYFNNKEFSKAEREWKQALTINPYHTKVLNNLGVLYYVTKEYQKALHKFQSIASLQPDNEDVKFKIADIKEKIKRIGDSQ